MDRFLIVPKDGTGAKLVERITQEYQKLKEENKIRIFQIEGQYLVDEIDVNGAEDEVPYHQN